MKHSQMKQSIDHSISQRPLLTEAFVQKIVAQHPIQRKRKEWIKPLIITAVALCLAVVLGLSTSYYKDTTSDTDVYVAKEDHLTQALFNDQQNASSYMLFENGTLTIYNDERLENIRPNTDLSTFEAGEKTEETYKNIKIHVRGNQYIITAEGDLTLTLTRIGERLIQTEDGRIFMTSHYLK